MPRRPVIDPLILILKGHLKLLVLGQMVLAW